MIKEKTKESRMQEYARQSGSPGASSNHNGAKLQEDMKENGGKSPRYKVLMTALVRTAGFLPQRR